MTSNDMFLHKLPFPALDELCRILDRDKRWEELAGKYMNLNMMHLHDLRRDDERGLSPTHQLLTFWGQQIHTVVHLFVLLSEMHHYQAMTVLKPYVDSRYHPLIDEGEENISVMFDEGNTSATVSQMDENFGCHNFDVQVEEQNRTLHKELLPPVQETSEIKILNTSVVVGDDTEMKRDSAVLALHMNSKSSDLQPLQCAHELKSECKENDKLLSSETSSRSPSRADLKQPTCLSETPLTWSPSTPGAAAECPASKSNAIGMPLTSASSIDTVSVDDIEDNECKEGNKDAEPENGDMITQPKESNLTSIGKDPLAIFQ